MSKIIKCSSIFLTCAAVVGVVSTAVFSAKAALKAKALLENAKDDKEDELTKTEMIYIVGPVYIPSILMGAATISCIFGINVLNKKQQASLISAYTLLNRYHEEYKEKLKELYGEEADIRIQNEICRSSCNYHQWFLDTPDKKVKFYDELSGRTITRFEREIMDAEYHLNRNYILRGYAFLNEFYEFLGLPATEYGGTVGWSMCSGINWVDFEHTVMPDKSGKKYLINMIFPPYELEEWEC